MRSPAHLPPYRPLEGPLSSLLAVLLLLFGLLKALAAGNYWYLAALPLMIPAAFIGCGVLVTLLYDRYYRWFRNPGSF